MRSIKIRHLRISAGEEYKQKSTRSERMSFRELKVIFMHSFSKECFCFGSFFIQLPLAKQGYCKRRLRPFDNDCIALSLF